jgi:amphi-Trp domain-containing protein
MPEEVIFTFEDRMDRADAAAYLRRVADRLEAGELSLSAGEQSLALSPPARLTFEVKAERETGTGGGSPELSVEFELEWDEGAGEGDAGGSLSVE